MRDYYSIRKLRDDIEIPEYKTEKAAGFDLAVAEYSIVPSGVPTLLHTGLVIGAPSNHMLMLALRSSAPKKWGIMMPHGVGIVDEDYCGEGDEILIQVMRFASGSTYIPKGERVAQGIFIPVLQGTPQRFEPGVSRGGFGSTG